MAFFKLFSLMSLASTALVATSIQASTLDNVRKKGFLQCGVSQGLAEVGQVAEWDRVDQEGARPLAGELDEGRALAVAVTGRTLGVDRDRPGAACQRLDGHVQLCWLCDDRRNAP